MVRKLHMKESIYTDNGYKNRNDYLKSLADDSNEDYIDPEIVGNKCAEINIDDILHLAEL